MSVAKRQVEAEIQKLRDRDHQSRLRRNARLLDITLEQYRRLEALWQKSKGRGGE